MSLFKENKTSRELDDTTTLVNDFVRQKPFGTYRPVNYRIPDSFMNLKEEIDSYLETLFAGKIDDANGDVLDNLIFDNTRMAFKNMKQQKTEHSDTIRNFSIQAEGARTAFEEHKQNIEEMSAEVRSRLGSMKLRLTDDEFGGKQK